MSRHGRTVAADRSATAEAAVALALLDARALAAREPRGFAGLAAQVISDPDATDRQLRALSDAPASSAARPSELVARKAILELAEGDAGDLALAPPELLAAVFVDRDLLLRLALIRHPRHHSRLTAAAKLPPAASRYAGPGPAGLAAAAVIVVGVIVAAILATALPRGTEPLATGPGDDAPADVADDAAPDAGDPGPTVMQHALSAPEPEVRLLAATHFYRRPEPPPVSATAVLIDALNDPRHQGFARRLLLDRGAADVQIWADVVAEGPDSSVDRVADLIEALGRDAGAALERVAAEAATAATRRLGAERLLGELRARASATAGSRSRGGPLPPRISFVTATYDTDDPRGVVRDTVLADAAGVYTLRQTADGAIEIVVVSPGNCFVRRFADLADFRTAMPGPAALLLPPHHNDDAPSRSR
jgi:hypothetical protein